MSGGVASQLPEAWAGPDGRAPLPGCTRVRDVAGVRVYTIDGDDYLSTGGVLKLSPWGRIEHVPPFALEYGRMRGSLVDEACRLADENDLDWDALSPKLRPYVEAWCAWRDENVDAILATEALVRADDLLTFGYIDRRVVTRRGDVVTIDLKTSLVVTDREKLQVSSYLGANEIGLVLQLTKAREAVPHYLDTGYAFRQRFAHLARESHAWVQQQEAR